MQFKAAVIALLTASVFAAPVAQPQFDDLADVLLDILKLPGNILKTGLDATGKVAKGSIGVVTDIANIGVDATTDVAKAGLKGVTGIANAGVKGTLGVAKAGLGAVSDVADSLAY